uniref:Putative secreted peptide n=1 Tax=Anopheles braziliensis TaxID=58242 RepID=A0A2M3ZV81_9DIPT
MPVLAIDSVWLCARSVSSVRRVLLLVLPWCAFAEPFFFPSPEGSFFLNLPSFSAFRPYDVPPARFHCFVLATVASVNSFGLATKRPDDEVSSSRLRHAVQRLPIEVPRASKPRVGSSKLGSLRVHKATTMQAIENAPTTVSTRWGRRANSL